MSSIAKLEALHQAATPGPWHKQGKTVLGLGEKERVVAQFPSGGGRSYVGQRDPRQAEADAAFVAAVGTDMPAVLRALRAAQAITDYGERPFNKADAPIPGPLALLMVKLNIALASLSAPSQEAQR
jgi:Iap family predicted aminopeptidase